jgi:hypothetical protein
MFVFYKPEYSPTTLSGQVGGNIGTTVLSGYLGEVFAYVDAPPSGIDPVFQYRKLFIKNTYTSTIGYTRVWLDAVEHPEQITVANSLFYNDYTSGSTFAPTGVSGWISPSNFLSGLDLGTLRPNSTTGFWIRQTLSGIESADPYATLRLYVGGVLQ